MCLFHRAFPFPIFLSLGVLSLTILASVARVTGGRYDFRARPARRPSGVAILPLLLLLVAPFTP